MNVIDCRMSEDQIRYDLLASEALQGIIRSVLQRVQKRGLPGEHHFFISFDTNAPGTIISRRLKEQYPEEMTIVIQYQFWDLVVYDDRFEVKLSFGNVPERLVIPYSAINTFVDPSVSFGFSPKLFAAAAAGDATPAARTDEDEAAQTQSALPRPAAQDADSTAPDTESQEPDAAIEQDERPQKQTADVVELDLFRKK